MLIVEADAVPAVTAEGATQDIAAVHPVEVYNPSEVNLKVKLPSDEQEVTVPGLEAEEYCPINGAAVLLPLYICK